MIKKYDLKTQQRQLQEEVYDKYYKITRIISLETQYMRTRTRIFQNKTTKRFVLCTENLDFKKNT
jgi:hypothetical protein